MKLVIVIPAFKEEKTIQNVIASGIPLDFDPIKGREILVIDNGSADGTGVDRMNKSLFLN